MKREEIQKLFTGENVGEVLFDEPMSKHTSWRIGGPADVFILPTEQEHLVRIISCEDRPADSVPLQESNHRPLWHPQNVVPPLQSQESSRLTTGQTMHAEQQTLHEELIFEAGRLGDSVQMLQGHMPTPRATE